MAGKAMEKISRRLCRAVLLLSTLVLLLAAVPAGAAVTSRMLINEGRDSYGFKMLSETYKGGKQVYYYQLQDDYAKKKVRIMVCNKKYRKQKSITLKLKVPASPTVEADENGSFYAAYTATDRTLYISKYTSAGKHVKTLRIPFQEGEYRVPYIKSMIVRNGMLYGQGWGTIPKYGEHCGYYLINTETMKKITYSDMYGFPGGCDLLAGKDGVYLAQYISEGPEFKIFYFPYSSWADGWTTYLEVPGDVLRNLEGGTSEGVALEEAENGILVVGTRRIDLEKIYGSDRLFIQCLDKETGKPMLGKNSGDRYYVKKKSVVWLTKNSDEENHIEGVYALGNDRFAICYTRHKEGDYSKEWMNVMVVSSSGKILQKTRVIQSPDKSDWIAGKVVYHNGCLFWVREKIDVAADNKLMLYQMKLS